VRTFRITVNGNAYDVQVEELEASTPVLPTKPAPVVVTAPVPVAAPTPAPPALAPVRATTVAAGATKIEAPMPGAILEVRVESGTAVKRGDVLFILEAMKMENEIMAPVHGVVTVHTSKGSSVNAGDLLASLS